MRRPGRGRRGCRITLALATVLATAAPAHPAAAQPPGAAPAPGSRLLYLEDDRRKPIESPLEVCFQVELRTECRQVAPGESVRTPGAFNSLRIEGPGHGPLSLTRTGLFAGAPAVPRAGAAGAAFRLEVPRKAVLHIEAGRPGRLPQPLTVSLYRPQDPSFREPAFRATLAPGESRIKIPAGELIASLAAGGKAPDLRRLRAQPGEEVHLAYQPRPGWSLVARLRAAADDRPVGAAQVKLVETTGFGQPERPVAESVSGLDGLVLISGLTAAMARLEARHAGFLAAEAPGLTASPGTFAFRELTLPTGGRLRAQISVHARPVPEARCELDALVPLPQDRKQPYRKLWEGNADAQGICRSALLAAGVYKLRVLAPRSASWASRWVTVPEGQDAEVDLPLAPARVSGAVTRNGKPVPGYRVGASRYDTERPQGARSDPDSEAASDDAGKYELTLWLPGTYTLGLRSSSGAPVAGQRQVTAAGDDEQTVDFDLIGSSLHGTVTDEAGRPVEAATVTLVGWEGGRSVASDGEGRFELELQGRGSATLRALKAGFRESDPFDVQVAQPDAPVPAVTLVLKRKATVKGTVISGTGAPVAAALVTSIALTPDGPDAYRSTRTAADGSFEVEVPPAGPPRVFVSGPACPLSSFELAPDSASTPAILGCPALPAALQLSLADEGGTPLAHAGLILRSGSLIVPHAVLVDHLMELGLAPETDGAGNLVLAGLAPGDYDLFLNGFSSEATIASGLRTGYLASVTLPALETTEIQLTIRKQP